MPLSGDDISISLADANGAMSGADGVLEIDYFFMAPDGMTDVTGNSLMFESLDFMSPYPVPITGGPRWGTYAAEGSESQFFLDGYLYLKAYSGARELQLVITEVRWNGMIIPFDYGSEW